MSRIGYCPQEFIGVWLDSNPTNESGVKVVGEDLKIEQLKASVVSKLVSTHGFTMDEAADAVTDAYEKDASEWHENSDVDQLAEYLASDDEV